MKGLLIAYSYSPNKTVGALRPTYWAEEIANHSSISLDVITATPNDQPNVFVVPHKSTSSYNKIIKDEGISWRLDVKQFLTNFSLTEYSFVILTGGPFFHFYSLSKFFKKQGLKVILDFRDPFSYNPRFNEKGLKKFIKKTYEKWAISKADLVVSVNQECHQYIAPSIHCKRAIIPNGFDERSLPKMTEMSKSNSLFYAGRLYWNPATFFETLSNNEWDLYHAGQSSDFDHPYIHSEHYHYLGMLNQKEMYKELQKHDIGVVFTINVPFESTTKIYDYIGLNKKILIVTQGKPGEGALMREMQNYPYYRWVENKDTAIKTAIEELNQLEVQPFDASPYSRKHTLELLIEELKAILN
ncbi:MAG: hypothetical protein M9916_09085 [Crocinitomicaceae bacterium]|nr:hypothetical protein [Crocinitomicaceae bacterium]